MTKKLSFIVPCLNSSKTLNACLESIVNQKAENIEYDLIIIDNGSSDETVEISRKYTKNVFQLLDVNIAHLRNYAVSLSDSEYFAFIDSDCVIPENFLSVAISLLDSGRSVVGSMVLWSAGEDCVAKIINQHNRTYPESGETNWFPSATLVISAQVFKSIGGFDENLITCEDVDLGYRLNKQGTKLYFDSRLTPIHLGDPDNFLGLIRKEYWRGTDSLVLLYKHGLNLKEIFTNLYQFWFYIFTCICIFFLFSGNSTCFAFSLFFLFLPVFLFSVRGFMKSSYKASFFGLIQYYSVYYIARSLALFRSLRRLLIYKRSSKSV